MKRCEYCRSYVKDDELKCPNCGAYVVDVPSVTPTPAPQITQTTGKEVAEKEKPDALVRVAFIFMIVAIVACAITATYTFFIGAIPLLWIIPMTKSLNRKIKRGEHISIGTKIAILIFCSRVAGILLLCAKTPDYLD